MVVSELKGNGVMAGAIWYKKRGSKPYKGGIELSGA